MKYATTASALVLAMTATHLATKLRPALLGIMSSSTMRSITRAAPPVRSLALLPSLLPSLALAMCCYLAACVRCSIPRAGHIQYGNPLRCLACAGLRAVQPRGRVMETGIDCLRLLGLLSSSSVLSGVHASARHYWLICLSASRLQEGLSLWPWTCSHTFRR